MIIVTFLLISSSYFTSAIEYHRSNKNECPPQEEIPMCSCIIKNEGLRVSCSRFETDEDLQNHLTKLKSYSLSKLEISSYNASTIPVDLFSGLEIGDLSLDKVEVEDASFRRGMRHFQGLEDSLRTLEIRKSFRTKGRTLLNLQLDHLKNLQEIILEHNSIPEVGNDWFPSGPSKLTVLILEHNSIEELGNQAFSSLTNLKLLAVAGNHLHTISRSMLPKTAEKLATLDLAYNKIRTLPTDIFSGMPALKDLNLENNFIHMIRQDTWGSIFSQLDSLNLKGNVLQCDEEMKWICETRLPDSIYGKCGSPAETKGLPLQLFCN